MIPSLLSGFLSALSLPTVIGPFHFPDLGFLAWFSLIPFYLSLRGASQTSIRRAFWIGFFFGTSYFGVSFYWIFIALHRYGDVPVPWSLLAVLFVVGLMSLYVGGAAATSIFASRKRVPLFLTLSLAWVVWEFLRSMVPFGGFPWASLVYSQRSFFTLLQMLDLTGIYGPLFLLIFTNGVLGEVFLALRRKRAFPIRGMALLFLLIVASLVYGSMRWKQVQGDVTLAPRLKLALVQGNIPQEEKWLDEKMEEIIGRYVVLSEEAEREAIDLLIWPEASYPAVIPPEIRRVDLLSSLQVPLLMGVVTYEGIIPEEWPPSPDNTNFRLHNSAVVIEPGGWIGGRYDKTHLVPLGEYVPLPRLLFFLNQVVPMISSFSPGRELNLLTLTPGPPPTSMWERGAEGGVRIQFGVTICYEDLFPEISRDLTRKGARFLTNLTNDAWYEHSSAVFHHRDFSRFRAIENRRSMVRATNTGVTAVFSPTGEILAEAPVFKEAVLHADLPLVSRSSLYTRFGDLFVGICAIFLGFLLFLPWRKGSV